MMTDKAIEPIVVDGNRIIPLAEVKVLTPAEIAAKRSVLATMLHTRDSAEAGIERLQAELAVCNDKTAMMVMTLHRFMPKVARLLADLEWAGSITHHICPQCHLSRGHGHDEGCKLAAIMREMEA